MAVLSIRPTTFFSTRARLIGMMRFSFFTIASTVLLPVFTYASSHSLDRRAIATIPGYTQKGCYTEATNQRALTGTSYTDVQMTVEKCAAACSGYTWFGVEDATEVCHCTNSAATANNIKVLLWQYC